MPVGPEWGMPCCKETEKQVLKQASLGSHTGRWRAALKARTRLFAACGVLVGKQAPATRQHRSSTWVATRSASAGFSQYKSELPAECEGWRTAAENMPDNSRLGRRHGLFKRSWHHKENTGFLPVRTHQEHVATVSRGAETKMLNIEKFNPHRLNGGKKSRKKKSLFLQPHLQINYLCSPGFLTVENIEAIALCLHLGGPEFCGIRWSAQEWLILVQVLSACWLLAQEQDVQQHGIQNAGPATPAVCSYSSLPRGCASRHTTVRGHLRPGESLTTFSSCSLLPYSPKCSISGPEKAFRAA